ncbi:M28 family metallopeptidase [Methanococcoides burtonii]|uniref:Protein with peptidase family M28 domain n=1 Tax=Methanococcoides burtonii (strain DSM 6242 / NBRC 107633 / OCM 468 / ACE-M) TaxID=259564 RepID=Q12V88_METBU|nr:M28 family peptidase [Methanococcoides burtonii]ABE52638.1 Protein with peptidase family M28 domain [Methanococcoides burtonii DSM 6242]
MVEFFNIKKYSELFLTAFLICILTTTSLTVGEAYSEDTSSPDFTVNTSNLEQITQKIVSHGPRITVYSSLSSEMEHEEGKLATEQSVEYIKNTMEMYGLETSLEEIRDEPFSINNIIGVKRGTNLENQIIIVCSHYDTARTSPGADDAALGVAATLEIARLLQDYELNRTVYFMVFPEHSQPIGADMWIEMHPDLKNNITGLICLDQIGYGNNLQISYIPQTSWLADIVQLSANESNISVSKHMGLIAFSDHTPFIQNNIPAVELIESEFTPFHHKPGDTIETINFSLAENATEIAVESVYHLATPEDIEPPLVDISSPNNLAVHGNNIIPLMYNISENDTHVQVLLDGQNLGEISSGEWLIFSLAQHDIKVWAIDEYGNRGEATASFEVIDYPEILKGGSDTGSKTYGLGFFAILLIILVVVLRSKRNK